MVENEAGKRRFRKRGKGRKGGKEKDTKEWQKQKLEVKEGKRLTRSDMQLLLLRTDDVIILTCNVPAILTLQLEVKKKGNALTHRDRQLLLLEADNVITAVTDRSRV